MENVCVKQDGLVTTAKKWWLVILYVIPADQELQLMIVSIAQITHHGIKANVFVMYFGQERLVMSTKDLVMIDVLAVLDLVNMTASYA